MEGIGLQDVVNALLKWRGNVKAAAEDLGLRRKNLYERIQRAGLNLEGFRRPGQTVEPFDRDVTRASRMTPLPRDMARAGNAVPKSSRGPYRGNAGLPTITDVEQAALDAPIRPVRTKRFQPRLPPDHCDQLREAKLDFGAWFRIETDENAILAQFFEECFSEWKAGKAAKAKSQGANGGRKK